MSQKPSQKRGRSQKQAKQKSQNPKLPPVEEMAPEMTPELLMELFRMPTEELERKVAEKRALHERVAANMVEKRKHLLKLVEYKAQVEVQMKHNQRYHAKQNQLVSEGLETFREVQELYNELVDGFSQSQVKAGEMRAQYQNAARKFVESSKKMDLEAESWNNILAEKQAESEEVDQRILELERQLADKRSENAQRRIELQGKKQVVSDLKVKAASVDLNAITATLEKAKLNIEEKSQQSQALRDKIQTAKIAQGEIAMNKIIAEAALEEAEQEFAQKTEKSKERVSKLNEQLSLVKMTVAMKMEERSDRIQQGNQKLAAQAQKKTTKIAENQTLIGQQEKQLENISKEVQDAEREQAQKNDDNMKLSKEIAELPQESVDRKPEIAKLEEKIKTITSETVAVRKEAKEATHKLSRKVKKEQRRQAFLGILSEESSAGAGSDTEAFDPIISASLAPDVVVNLQKVDLNETNDACAQLEQMKHH